MFRRSAAYALVVLLGLLSASAQRRSQIPRQNTELVIKVTYENDRAVADQIKIQLTTPAGVPMAETFTRGEGEARFYNMEPGTYRIRATGTDIEERTSDSSFVINPREITHIEFFQVRRKSNGQATSTEGSISAAALNIPAKAESEFDKGVSAMKKQNLDEAQKRFARAVEVYPRYAAAFNNLGVIAMQRGNAAEGKSFFQQAMNADDQYAPPYLNLAKSHIGGKQYPEAMQLLTKANSLDPNNVEVLALLTMLEYDSSQMSSALSHARKLHTMPGHEKFAFAHYIAGKALEAQSQSQDALVEYRIFLKESPQGPTAVKVQASIDAIEKRKQ